MLTRAAIIASVCIRVATAEPYILCKRHPRPRYTSINADVAVAIAIRHVYASGISWGYSDVPRTVDGSPTEGCEVVWSDHVLPDDIGVVADIRTCNVGCTNFRSVIGDIYA